MATSVEDDVDAEPTFSISQFKPSGDRIVIKPLVSKRTKGGIIVTDNGNVPPRFGKIVAVGPGRRNEKGDLVAMGFKVGDTVVLSGYPGQEIKDCDGNLYFILRDPEIAGNIA